MDVVVVSSSVTPSEGGAEVGWAGAVGGEESNLSVHYRV